MPVRIQIILCAIDFSAHTPLLLQVGACLAKRFGARLLIFHALGFPRGDPNIPPAAQFDVALQKMRDKASRRIEHAMKPHAVDWLPLLLPGRPVEAAARIAARQPIDLVMAAHHGLGRLHRLILGTVVERMARELRRPFLVTPPLPASPGPGTCRSVEFSRLLVGCDLSSTTSSTLDYANYFATHFGAEVHLLHTLESPVDNDPALRMEGSYSEVEMRLQNRLRERLQKLYLNRSHTRHPFVMAIETGLPGEALITYARNHRIDLIIVGLKRHGAIERLLMGSTTEAVLRAATCPVLVAPPKRLPVLRKPILSGKSSTLTDTGIIQDPRYLEHIQGHPSPENPRRLVGLYSMLQEPELRRRLVDVPPRLASPQEILLNHSPEYLQQVANTRGKSLYALSGDTYVSEKSYEAALLAAGGILQAIDQVLSGRIKRVFSLQRPPGHHAERGRAMGFCIFNNVAIGARYARTFPGLRRVLIVDWDVHHGNGTQHAFETDPSVLFFSIHQFPHFPGTGLFTEAGRGKGEGFTINIPLGKGYGNAEYAFIFEKILRPVALEFGPDLILVSAGFDIHQSDPLGAMNVSSSGFAALTRSIMTIADLCCGGKVVFAFEGGYNLQVLQSSVRAALTELTDQTRSDPEAAARAANPKSMQTIFNRCSHVHQHFWAGLSATTRFQ